VGQQPGLPWPAHQAGGDSPPARPPGAAPCPALCAPPHGVLTASGASGACLCPRGRRCVVPWGCHLRFCIVASWHPDCRCGIAGSCDLCFGCGCSCHLVDCAHHARLVGTDCRAVSWRACCVGGHLVLVWATGCGCGTMQEVMDCGWGCGETVAAVVPDDPWRLNGYPGCQVSLIIWPIRCCQRVLCDLAVVSNQRMHVMRRFIQNRGIKRQANAWRTKRVPAGVCWIT